MKKIYYVVSYRHKKFCIIFSIKTAYCTVFSIILVGVCERNRKNILRWLLNVITWFENINWLINKCPGIWYLKILFIYFTKQNKNHFRNKKLCFKINKMCCSWTDKKMLQLWIIRKKLSFFSTNSNFLIPVETWMVYYYN